MEDQQSKSNDDSSKKPVINDIVPPPAPEKDIKSDVEVEYSTDAKSLTEEPSLNTSEFVSDETNESAQVDDESVVSPPEVEVNSSDESAANSNLDSDEQIMDNNDIGNTEKQIVDSEVKPSNAMPPTAVGVSASQMKAVKPNRNNKKMAVAVTMLAAILLAGAAVYVYMKTNTNTKKSTNNSTSENSTENNTNLSTTEITPATTDDLANSSKEIEDAINALDETADFAEQDLSDTTLNL